MKKKFVIVLTPLLCFLLIWGISLARCEMLTLIHGSEFENLFEDAPIAPPKYLKVLNYSGTQASIYCVSEGYTMGNILVYTKKDGKWQFKEWDTVWSTSGNADDIIWPYWWHFFYSHRRWEDS